MAGLVDSVVEAEAAEKEADRIARKIGTARAVVVLGCGYEHATALEAARKIKELARVWAEPCSSADFAHGPIALLERGAPVLLFSARGAAQSDARALSRTLRSKGAKVYAVTNDAGMAELADDAVLLGSPLSEALTPISFAVAAQLVALCLARRLGRAVERPRGPSKVTRTR